MTCIVGYESDGKVYIGGDSAGVRGLDVTVREDSKVFKKEGLGYGNDSRITSTHLSKMVLYMVVHFSLDIKESYIVLRVTSKWRNHLNHIVPRGVVRIMHLVPCISYMRESLVYYMGTQQRQKSSRH
jgi:hypothetical protein